jgi:hypothetical protein
VKRRTSVIEAEFNSKFYQFVAELGCGCERSAFLDESAALAIKKLWFPEGSSNARKIKILIGANGESTLWVFSRRDLREKP